MPANFFFRDLGLIRHWSVMRAVTDGLESTPKKLPAWLLYDARGAQLFESITRTPDYYLTRTEASILTGRRTDLAEIIDARTCSSWNTAQARCARSDCCWPRRCRPATWR